MTVFRGRAATLGEAFDAVLRAAPDAPFLETVPVEPDAGDPGPGGPGEGAARRSRGKLRERAIAHAAALGAQGARVGDRIAVVAHKRAEVLALYLACLRKGCVFLPLNAGATTPELESLCRDAEPRLLVAPATALEALAPLRPLVALRALEELSASDAGEDEPHEADAEDTAVLLYTSGTTGRPKGAMLTHRALLSNARTLIDAWAIDEGDVLLHILPIHHAHGLFVAFHTILIAGGRMLFLERFTAERVTDLLPRCSLLMGVPTHYGRLLAHDGFTADACRGIRLFVSGSAPLPPTAFEAFHARTGHSILERYGMTETGMNSSNPLRGPRKAGSVGPPLEGIAIRITGSDGAQLPEGGVGRVEVKGPNLFSGYWRRPEATAEEHTEDGYFITGDLGRFDEDGYLWLVGRAKDLIITGGLNVYPREIEERLDALPGVRESAVIGLPDPDYGELVTAIVVPAEGAELEPERVIAALRAELASYKLPKRVLVRSALPRNSMGKVEKNRLREEHG